MAPQPLGVSVWQKTFCFLNDVYQAYSFKVFDRKFTSHNSPKSYFLILHWEFQSKEEKFLISICNFVFLPPYPLIPLRVLKHLNNLEALPCVAQFDFAPKSSSKIQDTKHYGVMEHLFSGWVTLRKTWQSTLPDAQSRTFGSGLGLGQKV